MPETDVTPRVQPSPQSFAAPHLFPRTTMKWAPAPPQARRRKMSTPPLPVLLPWLLRAMTLEPLPTGLAWGAVVVVPVPTHLSPLTMAHLIHRRLPLALLCPCLLSPLRRSSLLPSRLHLLLRFWHLMTDALRLKPYLRPQAAGPQPQQLDPRAVIASLLPVHLRRLLHRHHAPLEVSVALVSGHH